MKYAAVFCLLFIVPLIAATEEAQCPSSHPFAYLHGKYCCAFANENVHESDGTLCDGGTIGLSSTCCKNDHYAPCPHEVCANNAEITAMRCNGQDDGCCTDSTPCDLGEGDCDKNSHCAGSLICGTDNCPWGDGDDCCMKKPTDDSDIEGCQDYDHSCSYWAENGECETYPMFMSNVCKNTCGLCIGGGGHHPCDKDNGGCHDICERKTNTATCKCTKPGRVLGADGKSCA